MCLCNKSLNSHCIYKAIKNGIKSIDLSHSLTEFLCTKFNCQRNKTVNYYNKDCIEEKCKNNCKPADITSYLHDNMTDELPKTIMPYYVYENVSTKYYNKQGKEVFYDRTARLDEREPLADCIVKLQELAVPYLLHQFSVCCDTVYWNEFLNQTSHYVLWLNYSQNFALKEKKQVQSAHFSGKQQTLHNTVLYKPNRQGHKFLYHLSDDTNHNHVFTFSVINDIICYIILK